MHIRRYIIVAILGGLAFQPALAGQGRLEDRGRFHEMERPAERLRPPGGHMTANEAAARAQKNNGGGRVLSVDNTGNGYRVKLLQRGDVNIVFVPAE